MAHRLHDLVVMAFDAEKSGFGSRARSMVRTAALVAVTVSMPGGCDADAGATYVQLDHYRQPCEDDATSFCFRVLEQDSAQPLALQSIDGFTYRWGHIYDLLIEPSPTQPGRARLVEILDEAVVASDARFELALQPKHVQRVDEWQLELRESITARCPDTSVCLEVVRALSEDEPFMVQLGRDATQEGFVAHHVRVMP